MTLRVTCQTCVTHNIDTMGEVGRFLIKAYFVSEFSQCCRDTIVQECPRITTPEIIDVIEFFVLNFLDLFNIR